VIRSCDALRASGVIITGHAADLYDPETIRATTGSFFNVPAVRLPSHQELFAWADRQKQRIAGLQTVGSSAKATMLIQDFDFTQPTILIAGNESHGLSENYRAACNGMVKIPMYGSASSLNLAVAVSIMLYEIDRQRVKNE
jgi:TrmH family RNA methyltransferase